jgi:hypothetical protein
MFEYIRSVFLSLSLTSVSLILAWSLLRKRPGDRKPIGSGQLASEDTGNDSFVKVGDEGLGEDEQSWQDSVNDIVLNDGDERLLDIGQASEKQEHDRLSAVQGSSFSGQDVVVEQQKIQGTAETSSTGHVVGVAGEPNIEPPISHVVVENVRPAADARCSEPSAGSPVEGRSRADLHCFHCGKYDGPLLRCSRCASVCFCSVDCQRVSWKVHKSDCARMARERGASKTVVASPTKHPSTSEETVQKNLTKRNPAIVCEEETGARLFQQGQYREAHSAFSRMQEKAQEIDLPNEEGRAWRLIGNALDKLNAPGRDIEDAYKRALRSAHQHDDMELSFNVLTGMASHAVKTDDSDLAEHFYLQALTLAQRVLSQEEVALAEANLAMCLARSDGRRQESYSHFRKAISLQQKSLNSRVTLHANLASTLSADGKTKDALIEYNRALGLAREIGNRRVEMNVLVNLSNLYDGELGEAEKARQCRERLAELRDGCFKANEPVSTSTKAPAVAEDAICAICLGALEQPATSSEEPKPIIILPCMHAFHRMCWNGCSEQRCPLCRDGLSFAAK